MLKRGLVLLVPLFLMLFLSLNTGLAKDSRSSSGRSRSSSGRTYYGGGKHTSSHGGRYASGRGSSHKGGRYMGPTGSGRYGPTQVTLLAVLIGTRRGSSFASFRPNILSILSSRAITSLNSVFSA